MSTPELDAIAARLKILVQKLTACADPNERRELLEQMRRTIVQIDLLAHEGEGKDGGSEGHAPEGRPPRPPPGGKG